MDMVYGKCVHSGALAFIIGGGYTVWSAGLSGRALPFREAAVDGLYASRVVVAGTAAAGAVSFLQHGRYSPRLLMLRGDPAATFAGVATAAWLAIGPAPRPQRVLMALGTGALAAIISGRLGR